MKTYKRIKKTILVTSNLSCFAAPAFIQAHGPGRSNTFRSWWGLEQEQFFCRANPAKLLSICEKVFQGFNRAVGRTDTIQRDFVTRMWYCLVFAHAKFSFVLKKLQVFRGSVPGQRKIVFVVTPKH